MVLKRFSNKSEAKSFQKSKKKAGYKTKFQSIRGKSNPISIKRGRYRVTYNK